MDPKVFLDFINVWYEDPNTPIDDLKLPPGVSHMVATLINEAKWKEQKAKQAKIAKARKEKFLRQNVLKLTPEALVSTFINEVKWKEQQARQAKFAKAKKEKFLTQNLLKLTPDALVSTQAELQVLTDKCDKLSDRKSIKRNFIKLATSAVDD